MSVMPASRTREVTLGGAAWTGQSEPPPSLLTWSVMVGVGERLEFLTDAPIEMERVADELSIEPVATRWIVASHLENAVAQVKP